jgi:hypothetical protein
MSVVLSVRRITRVTEKAFQLLLDGNNPRFVWVPKKAVVNWTEYKGGDWDVEMELAHWFTPQFDPEAEADWSPPAPRG